MTSLSIPPTSHRELSFGVRQSRVQIPTVTLGSLQSRVGLSLLTCKVGTIPSTTWGSRGGPGRESRCRACWKDPGGRSGRVRALPFGPGLVPLVPENSQTHFICHSIRGCDYCTWKRGKELGTTSHKLPARRQEPGQVEGPSGHARP